MSSGLSQLARLRRHRNQMARRLEIAAGAARQACSDAEASHAIAEKRLAAWRADGQSRLVRNLLNARKHMSASRQISALYAASASDADSMLELLEISQRSARTLEEKRRDRNDLVQRHRVAMRKAELLDRLLGDMERHESLLRELCQEDEVVPGLRRFAGKSFASIQMAGSLAPGRDQP